MTSSLSDITKVWLTSMSAQWRAAEAHRDAPGPGAPEAMFLQAARTCAAGAGFAQGGSAEAWLDTQGLFRGQKRPTGPLEGLLVEEAADPVRMEGERRLTRAFLAAVREALGPEAEAHFPPIDGPAATLEPWARLVHRLWAQGEGLRDNPPAALAHFDVANASLSRGVNAVLRYEKEEIDAFEVEALLLDYRRSLAASVEGAEISWMQATAEDADRMRGILLKGMGWLGEKLPPELREELDWPAPVPEAEPEAGPQPA